MFTRLMWKIHRNSDLDVIWSGEYREIRMRDGQNGSEKRHEPPPLVERESMRPKVFASITSLRPERNFLSAALISV